MLKSALLQVRRSPPKPMFPHRPFRGRVSLFSFLLSASSSARLPPLAAVSSSSRRGVFLLYVFALASLSSLRYRRFPKFQVCGISPCVDGGSHLSAHRVNYVTMRQHRYLQYLDNGNITNFTSPGSSNSACPSLHTHKGNAFIPEVVAVLGVLACAFLIVSYYRIFLRYCNHHHIIFWGSLIDNRNGGPSTIISKSHYILSNIALLVRSIVCIR